MTYWAVDCDTCYGFGMWPDIQAPVYESEAREGHYTDPCPDCGSDNTFYELQCDSEDCSSDSSEPLNINKKDFNDICVE